MERQQYPGITLDMWNAPQHQKPKPTIRKIEKSQRSRNRHVRFSSRIQIGHTWSSSQYDRHGCSGPTDETARPTSAGSTSGNRNVHTSMQPSPTPDTAPTANFSVGEHARPQHAEIGPKTSNVGQKVGHIRRKVSKLFH